MDTLEMLDALSREARRKEELYEKFIRSREEKNPVDAFCRVAQEAGYPIYPMDLLSAGEDFYASMRRSTNGGGENSPMLEGEDDFYELFFAGLQK